MFVANFGGMMAMATNLPYCLMYPNIYSSTIPEKDRHHFNVQGSPPRLHTCICICQALLQHANMSEDYRQQYEGSHLVISWGVQYEHLLPETIMPCNHWALLVDLSTGKPFPLVPVGDLQLEDNIFPGMPGDSLLYTSTSQSSHSSGEVPS